MHSGSLSIPYLTHPQPNLEFSLPPGCAGTNCEVSHPVSSKVLQGICNQYTPYKIIFKKSSEIYQQYLLHFHIVSETNATGSYRRQVPTVFQIAIRFQDLKNELCHHSSQKGMIQYISKSRETDKYKMKLRTQLFAPGNY